GKAGVTHFHTGAGDEKLGILHRLLDEYSEIPPHVIHATHITRSKALIEDAVRLAKRGAYVDMDTIDDDFGESYVWYRENGGPLDKLTVSSDAGAGTSKGVRTLWNAFVRGARDYKLAVEEILPCWTSNTANVLKLGSKGRIAEGIDGDVVVVGKGDWEIRGVFAMGRRVV
ncbi:MAG: beta-aspartyl-peptidase, partial [Chloroflexia bacterium]